MICRQKKKEVKKPFKCLSYFRGILQLEEEEGEEEEDGVGDDNDNNNQRKKRLENKMLFLLIKLF